MLLTKVSSRHQITIPKIIADVFDLKKGDFLGVERKENKIVLIPKEAIFEDKYSIEDLEAAEKVLSKGLPKEEIVFKSGTEAIRYLQKRIKK